MATFKHGSVSVNLGLLKLDGNLTDEDRQCAWELYAELITRVAVVGKWSDTEAKNFDGEIYAESLTSLYRFFQEARSIMRKFPVGKIKSPQQDHLGVMIQRILTDVLRPFLEKWQVNYRSWWEQEIRTGKNPFQLQQEFKERDQLLKDWQDVRLAMREAAHVICEAYKLEPVIPPSTTNATPPKPKII